MGIGSLFNTMQVPFFSAEPFPDCEPRNYLGFPFSRKCFKQSRKRDVMEISTGLTCPLLPATFPSLLMIILVTILPWNSLRSDGNNPHMSTGSIDRETQKSLLAIHADAHQGNGSHLTKGSDLSTHFQFHLKKMIAQMEGLKIYSTVLLYRSRYGIRISIYFSDDIRWHASKNIMNQVYWCHIIRHGYCPLATKMSKKNKNKWWLCDGP